MSVDDTLLCSFQVRLPLSRRDNFAHASSRRSSSRQRRRRCSRTTVVGRVVPSLRRANRRVARQSKRVGSPLGLYARIHGFRRWHWRLLSLLLVSNQTRPTGFIPLFYDPETCLVPRTGLSPHTAFHPLTSLLLLPLCKRNVMFNNFVCLLRAEIERSLACVPGFVSREHGSRSADSQVNSVFSLVAGLIGISQVNCAECVPEM